MSGVANTPSDVQRYAECTLLATSLLEEEKENNGEEEENNAITSCIKFLKENEFITLQKTASEGTEKFPSLEVYHPS